MEKIIKSMLEDLNTQMVGLKKFTHQLQEFEDSYDSSLATVEDRTIVNMLRNIIDPLEDIIAVAEFYKKDITTEGILHRDKTGRLLIDEVYLSNGIPIEFLVADCGEKPYWMKTRIESTSDGKYYAFDHPKLILDNAKARIRW